MISNQINHCDPAQVSLFILEGGGGGGGVGMNGSSTAGPISLSLEQSCFTMTYFLVIRFSSKEPSVVL